MKCPKCEAENSDGALYCSLCLSPFTRRSEGIDGIGSAQAVRDQVVVAAVSMPAIASRDNPVRNHIAAIAILDMVFGGLTALTALVAIFSTRASGSSLPAEAPFMALMGKLMFVVLVIGLLQVWLGVELRHYKPWARIVQIILACTNLLSFPLGTAFGAYVLWIMVRSDTARMFR